MAFPDPPDRRLKHLLELSLAKHDAEGILNSYFGTRIENARDALYDL